MNVGQSEVVCSKACRGLTEQPTRCWKTQPLVRKSQARQSVGASSYSIRTRQGAIIPMRIKRAKRAWVGRRSGAANVEYVLVMVGVAAAIFVGIAGLGYAVRSSFDSYVRQMHALAGNREVPDARATAPASEFHQDHDPSVHPIPWTMRFETWMAFASSATLLVFLVNLLVLRRAVRGTEEEDDVANANGELHDRVFLKRQEIFRILAKDMEILLLKSRLNVLHVMSRHVTSVAPQTSVDEVRRIMKEEHLRHLLVCRNDELVGIISDRDLRKTEARTAEDLMTPDPITVEPQTLLNPAITQMVQKRISCLPVVHEGAVVGVLTSTDLMMTLQCALQVLRRVAGEVAGSSEEEALEETFERETDSSSSRQEAGIGTEFSPTA